MRSVTSQVLLVISTGRSLRYVLGPFRKVVARLGR